MDKLSAERRSANMRRIRSTDTNLELTLRRLIHKLGYRFRLHRKDLPGRPDIVFPGLRKVIFMHGCFFGISIPVAGKAGYRVHALIIGDRNLIEIRFAMLPIRRA